MDNNLKDSCGNPGVSVKITKSPLNHLLVSRNEESRTNVPGKNDGVVTVARQYLDRQELVIEYAVRVSVVFLLGLKR